MNLCKPQQYVRPSCRVATGAKKRETWLFSHALPAVIFALPHPTALPPAGPQILTFPAFAVPVTRLCPAGENATPSPGQAVTTRSKVPPIIELQDFPFLCFTAGKMVSLHDTV